jgi:hypothetical protein
MREERERERVARPSNEVFLLTILKTDERKETTSKE